jgi:Ulp1 protease family, C-terminal catalytic domain
MHGRQSHNLTPCTLQPVSHHHTCSRQNEVGGICAHGPHHYAVRAGPYMDADAIDRMPDHSVPPVSFQDCGTIPPLPMGTSACEAMTGKEYARQVEAVHGVCQRACKGPPNAIVFRKLEDRPLNALTISLCASDIKRVVDGAWVGNAYVDQMCVSLVWAHPAAKRADGTFKYAIIPCDVLATFNPIYRQGVAGMESTGCRTTTWAPLPIMLRTASVLFAPIPLHNHFTLVVMHLAERVAYYFDTLGVTDTQMALRDVNQLLVILKHHNCLSWCGGKWRTVMVPRKQSVARLVDVPYKCPTQYDSENCGIFVHAIVEHLVWEQDPVDIDGLDLCKIRRHALWQLFHWCTHSQLPGGVLTWCAT